MTRDVRPGDIVNIYGKARLVVFVGGGLLITGKGRGYAKHWTLNEVEGVLARNFKLKSGKSFNGVTG